MMFHGLLKTEYKEFSRVGIVSVSFYWRHVA